jgi:hypothetical protein
MTVIGCLSSAENPLSIQEISSSTGIPYKTVYHQIQKGIADGKIELIPENTKVKHYRYIGKEPVVEKPPKRESLQVPKPITPGKMPSIPLAGRRETLADLITNAPVADFPAPNVVDRSLDWLEGLSLILGAYYARMIYDTPTYQVQAQLDDAKTRLLALLESCQTLSSLCNAILNEPRFFDALSLEKLPQLEYGLIEEFQQNVDVRMQKWTPIKRGETIKDFRGKEHVYYGMQYNRVLVQFGHSYREFFPTVFPGLTVKEDDE